jgi:hypothetical protein
MHNYNSGAPTVVALVNLREKANCGQAPDDYPHRDALACEVVPNAVHTVSVDIFFACDGNKFVWLALRHH